MSLDSKALEEYMSNPDNMDVILLHRNFHDIFINDMNLWYKMNAQVESWYFTVETKMPDLTDLGETTYHLCMRGNNGSVYTVTFKKGNELKEAIEKCLDSLGD